MTENLKKSIRVKASRPLVFNNFSALAASKWLQITHTNLANVLNSISKRFGPNFGENKRFVRDVGHYALSHTNFSNWQTSPEGGYNKKNWKTACDWVIIRSFHCPNLVGIGCNTDFLSRFKVINPETLKFTERDKKYPVQYVRLLLCWVTKFESTVWWLFPFLFLMFFRFLSEEDHMLGDFSHGLSRYSKQGLSVISIKGLC